MLKERRRATEIVTGSFLEAETAADLAATCAAQCVATMLAERKNANLPVAVGLEAISRVSEGARKLVEARQAFVEAHAMLLGVRSDIGLARMYGDAFDCPPTDKPRGAIDEPLRLVAGG